MKMSKNERTATPEPCFVDEVCYNMADLLSVQKELPKIGTPIVAGRYHIHLSDDFYDAPSGQGTYTQENLINYGCLPSQIRDPALVNMVGVARTEEALNAVYTKVFEDDVGINAAQALTDGRIKTAMVYVVNGEVLEAGFPLKLPQPATVINTSATNPVEIDDDDDDNDVDNNDTPKISSAYSESNAKAKTGEKGSESIFHCAHCKFSSSSQNEVIKHRSEVHSEVQTPAKTTLVQSPPSKPPSIAPKPPEQNVAFKLRLEGKGGTKLNVMRMYCKECITLHIVGKYTCRNCSFSTGCPHQLEKHMRERHLSEHVYHCPVCGWCDKNYQAIEDHLMQTHCTAAEKVLTGQSKVSPAQADAPPAKAPAKKQPAPVNREKDPEGGGDNKTYKCPSCAYSINTYNKMVGHARQHVASKFDAPMKCGVCGFSSQRRSSLIQHIRMRHGPESEKDMVINNKVLNAIRKEVDLFMTRVIVSPSAVFNVDGEIEEVVEGEDPPSEPLRNQSQFRETPFKCEYCDFSTKFELAFDSHVAGHLPFKPYGCSGCSKRFKFRVSFPPHSKTRHSGVSVTCEVDKVILQLQKSKLMELKHGKNVTQVKVTQVKEERDKVDEIEEDVDFIDEEEEELTEENTEYECHLCKLTLSNKKNAAAHYKTHHEKLRPNICNSCSYTAQRANAVLLHIRNIHQSNPSAALITDDAMVKAIEENTENYLSNLIARRKNKKMVVAMFGSMAKAVESTKQSVFALPDKEIQVPCFNVLKKGGTHTMFKCLAAKCGHTIRSGPQLKDHLLEHMSISEWQCPCCEYQNAEKILVSRHEKKTHHSNLDVLRNQLFDNLAKKLDPITKAACESIEIATEDDDEDQSEKIDEPPTKKSKTDEESAEPNDADSKKDEQLSSEKLVDTFTCKYCNKILESYTDALQHILDQHRKKHISIDVSLANVKRKGTGESNSDENRNDDEEIAEDEVEVKMEIEDNSEDSKKVEDPLDNNFLCHLCNYVPSGKSMQTSLEEHFAAAHCTEEPYICLYCGIGMSVMKSIKDHIKTAHPALKIDVSVNEDEEENLSSNVAKLMGEADASLKRLRKERDEAKLEEPLNVKKDLKVSLKKVEVDIQDDQIKCDGEVLKVVSTSDADEDEESVDNETVDEQYDSNKSRTTGKDGSQIAKIGEGGKLVKSPHKT